MATIPTRAMERLRSNDWLSRIPEPPRPKIILHGCRPLVPFHEKQSTGPDGYPTFRAARKACKPPVLGEDSSFAREACPTCKGLIGRKPEDPFFLDPDDPDSRTYCEACGAMAPRHEANVLGSRLGLIASKVADQAERTAILALRARARLGLTDSDRRKIAAGHRSYFGSSWRQVTNLSRLGRRFLAGQCADVETVGQTA